MLRRGSRSGCVALLGVAVLLLGATGIPSTVLAAGSCPDQLNYDFISDNYYAPNNRVAGIRAPIELRKGADICTGGAVFNWVGIQGDGLSQVGWSYDSDGYCRFYWDGTGDWKKDRCGTDSIGDVRLFKVENTLISGTHYYGIYDCGPADWGSCNRLMQGPEVSGMGNTFGIVATETPYGQGCHDEINGSQASPVVYGGAPGDIEGQNDYGGAFNVKTLDYTGATCSHYDSAIHSDQKMTTHDDRNG